MKKVFTITLNKIIFTAEDDAFGRLQGYLESIKNHYRSDGEEIVADIEAGIAEKLQAWANSAKVITLSDVEKVIAELGTVEQFDEEPTTESKEEKSESSEDQNAVRRLYRNSDDQVIAGVASGLAAYFGIDPVFARILFVVLTLINGLGIIIYLILWLAVPKAETSSQKLAMRGEAVNLKKIEETVKEKSSQLASEGATAVEKLKKNPFWYKLINFPIRLIEALVLALKKFFKVFWPVVAIAVGLIIVISAIACLVAMTAFTAILAFNLDATFIVSDLPLQQMASSPFYYPSLIAFYFIILVPVIFLLQLGLTLVMRRNAFKGIVVGVLLGIWILAVGVGVATAGKLAPLVIEKLEQRREQESISKNYEFKDFSKIYLGGNTRATVIKGNEFNVTATGLGDELNRLQMEIKDGQLQITEKHRSGWCFFCFDEPVMISITMPELKSFVGVNTSQAEISGFDQDLYVSLGEAARLNLTAPEAKLNLSLSGVSSVLKLSGSPRELDLTMSGVARFTALELQTKSITVKMSSASRSELSGVTDEFIGEFSGATLFSGSKLISQKSSVIAKDNSRITVWAEKNLKILADNNATVRYFCPGTIEAKRADNGRVIELDESGLDKEAVEIVPID